MFSIPTIWLISTIFSIPAAYGLARFRFKAKKGLILFFLITQMLPSTLVLTPLYIMFSRMGLLNTYLAPILADATLGIPFSIIILRTYFISIPKELDEAATMDGCGILQNLYAITLPLMKPVLATVTIFNFQGVWSEFYWALIMIRTESKRTLQLGLMNFQSQFGTDYGVLAAGLVMATLPILVIYLAFSSQFIGGMTAGAVKG